MASEDKPAQLARRGPRGRWIALGVAILLLALLAAISTGTALAVAVIFVPVVVGVTLMLTAIPRGWAAWPWVIGVGFCVVPATYMAAVRLCDNLGGVCPTGDALTHSKQAVYSLILFALACALLPVRRSPARDLAFAALVLLGEIWLVIKLQGVGERAGQIVVIVFAVMGVAYEILTRVRGEDSAAAT